MVLQNAISTAVLDETELISVAPYISALLSDFHFENGFTYSFLDADAESYDDIAGDTAQNPSFWLEYEQDAVRDAFMLFEEYTGVQFIEVEANSPDAAVQIYSTDNVDSEGGLGSAFTPNPDFPSFVYLNFQAPGWSEEALQRGGYGFLTITHEVIGHALGLEHPHDGLVFPGVTSSSESGELGLNNALYTNLSYVDGFDGSIENYGFQLPGPFDIYAWQYLYGANVETNTGDNVYELPTVNQPGTFYQTIWDANGLDTLSARTATADSVLDIEEFHVNGDELGDQLTSHVEGISGGILFANGTIIENANGSDYNDTIRGNRIANSLNGFAGNDLITGEEGNDRISGGTGNDTITGDEGHDVLFGESGDDIIVGANPDFFGAGSNEVDIMTGGDGYDTFIIGDAFEPYYRETGLAIITDFDPMQDYIQVHGASSNYHVLDLGESVSINYGSDQLAIVSNTNDVIIERDFLFA